MPQRTCIVIGAAKKGIEHSLLSGYVHLEGPDRAAVYCADGGLSRAETLGIRPDVLIGDFDSIEAKDFRSSSNAIHKSGAKSIKRLPAEKDETDLFACVLDGLKSGFKKFILIYCTGGRLDHFMGAIALLDYINGQGAEGILLDQQNEITLLSKGALIIKADKRYPYLSLMPLDNQLTGVSMTGVKYPLLDAVVLRESGIGISNEILGDEASISIKEGSALIIKSRDL